MTRLVRMPTRLSSGVEEFPCGPRGVETHMVRQMLPFAGLIAVLALAVSLALGGWDAALSAAIGVALGFGNLALSAAILERCARISPEALMFGALGGFLLRMILLLLVALGLKQLPVIEIVPVVVVLVITHVGLLIWEAFVVMAADRKRDRARVLKRATEGNAA